MQTILTHFSRTILLILLFCSCKKESDILVKTPKKFSPFEINGYVVGEPLEQYFDGVKLREFYGKVQIQYPAESAIAFMNDKTEMELRRKGTGEVVYRQTFKMEDAINKVPIFYFEKKWQSAIEYPEVTGTDFLVNFYFDVPADSAAADIYITVIEYYYDSDATTNPLKIIKLHDFPLAKNVKNGWTPFIKLSTLPELPKLRPDSEFWPMPTFKRAGSNEYYVSNDENRSTFNMQLPQGGESQGTVQSIHMMFDKGGAMTTNDLIPMYPK